MSGFFGGVCSEEKHEADDARTIVQQGFCIDKGGEALAGFQLVQQGYYGYRVGGTDQGSEHQCKCPCPRFKTGDEGRYSHHEGARQQHADDKSRCRQQGSVGQCFLENVQVEFVGCIENQDGQEKIKNQVGIDIGDGTDRIMQFR